MESKPARILVAEDDRSMQALVHRILSEEGHDVVLADDGKAAMARLEQPFALLLTDLRMPGADGIEVLRFARQRWPGMPVVVLTAYGSIPGAVDAMRQGAFDYLTKPLPDPASLRAVVQRALAAGSTPGGPIIVAEDPAMRAVIEQIRRVAPRETTVLLLGESGAGKEVLAQLLHRESPRRDGPFVAVNCAALADTLLESELFGHERGAFTGAHARHEGRFEQADGGTLLLDEIGETSPALQAKLLRVLQDRTFERVGGERPITVDVRLVAATNRVLSDDVRAGRFREDLYYRLAVFPLTVPPLRERPGDILPLSRHFLRLLTQGGSRTAPVLTDEANRALLAHPWPGNVRELCNVMERALILSGGDAIQAADLGLVGPAHAGGPERPASATLKDMERRAISEALASVDGNRRLAARKLGIALRTLQYKIKEYDLKE